jgi:hypothetical protein
MSLGRRSRPRRASRVLTRCRRSRPSASRSQTTMLGWRRRLRLQLSRRRITATETQPRACSAATLVAQRSAKGCAQRTQPATLTPGSAKLVTASSTSAAPATTLRGSSWPMPSTPPAARSSAAAPQHAARLAASATLRLAHASAIPRGEALRVLSCHSSRRSQWATATLLSCLGCRRFCPS